MKKFAGFALALTLCFASAHAKEDKFAEVQKIITIEDLTPETTKEFCLGMHPDTVIEFKEGSSLPLNFLLKNEIVSLKVNPQIGINVETTCYVRVIGKKAYMSTDMETWERPNAFFSGTYNAILKNAHNKEIVNETFSAD